MRAIWTFTFSILFLAGAAAATNYYVSPTGDDDNDGLAVGSAWASVDRGDALGVIDPGDTVTVLAGTYLPGIYTWISISGTADDPIVYRAAEKHQARIGLPGVDWSVFFLDADYVELDGFAITEGNHHGIYLGGSNCVVRDCLIYGMVWDGINIEGDDNLIYRNTIYGCEEDGIDNLAGATGNVIHHNTIYNVDWDGVFAPDPGTGLRVFNNIVVQNYRGIVGTPGDICGFNDVWANSAGNYAGGASDSAGGISEDPIFADPGTSDFTLQEGSPAINAGLDLGYAYSGSAPDMGAEEYGSGQNYYVSTAGNDDDDGLTIGTAWASVDNGDQKSLLVPGDTVNVLPGTYAVTSSIQLKTNGTSDEMITYRRLGAGAVVLDRGGESGALLLIEGDNAAVQGFDITGTSDQGVHVKADSCIVTECYVHHTGKECVSAEGSDCLFLRNIVAYSDEEGFKNESGADYNLYYGNTVYENTKHGFELKEKNSQVINNIIVGNDHGIDGNGDNVCMYNDVWGNADDYAGGVSDDGGSISADPRFVSEAGFNFELRGDSPAIDRGTDLGYPYYGLAPEMGAKEYYPHSPVDYYVSTTGADGADGLSPATAWATIDNGEVKGILLPGDAVNVLPGAYAPAGDIRLTASGTASARITYRAAGDGVVIDGGGQAIDIFQVDGDFVDLTGFYLTNNDDPGGNRAAILINGDSCSVSYCHLENVSAYGIKTEGDEGYFLRNVVSTAERIGIFNNIGATGNEYYGNTVYACHSGFVLFDPGSSRLFNNIVVNNALNGIQGISGHVIAHNCVWGNVQLDYIGGAADSSGGISVDPLFVDAVGGDFNLEPGSHCIDAGLDMGYSYSGLAPEMGALEYDQHAPTSYYVSQLGDDDNDGLSPGAAWASIDNGDFKGILVAGDTVNVLPGYYSLTEPVNLTTSGTADLKVTYRRLGDGRAIVDMNYTWNPGLVSGGNHVVIDGLELTNSQRDGIWLDGDSCLVTGCYIHYFDDDGVDVRGNYNIIKKNIVFLTGSDGILNREGAEHNRYIGNTLSGNGYAGIHIVTGVTTARIFNNITATSYIGLYGEAGNVCAFNDVWDWQYDSYYDGVADSAGGISADPMFVDPLGDNFYLGYGSQAIDAGTHIDYPFTGEAPDMGALESCPRAVRDEFNAQSYAGNDGAQLWSGPWSELGEGDGPTAGLVLVRNYIGCCPAPYCLRLGGYWNSTPINFGARREVDLDGATYAYLSYNYRRHPQDGYSASRPALVQVSGDGGFTWENLQVIGSGTDAECIPMLHDISDYIAEDTQIRFITNSASYIDGWVYFDNIQIQFDGNCDSAPALSNIEITPFYDPMFADSAYTFSVVATTDMGHETDPGGLSWSHTFSSGSIDASGKFTPEYVGTGEIVVTATEYGVKDTSETMTVVAGALDTLFVSPMRDTVSADSTRQFVAAGEDAKGNSIDDLGTLTWQVYENIGAIDSTGLFNAMRAGNGFIKVTSDLGMSIDTDTITVVPGDVAWIDVIPSDNVIVEAETYQYKAYGYDSDSNYVDDVTASSTWSVSACGSGCSITSGGLYTAPDSLAPPVCYVTATYGGASDSGSVVVISSLNYVQAETSGGGVFGDTTLTADNDTTRIYCRGYKDGGDPRGDVPAAWSILGEDSIGAVTPGPSVYTTLTLSRPGTGVVVATYNDSISDTTGIITCLAGEPARVVVSPHEAVVKADSTLQFYCASYDADGNLIEPQAIADWRVVNGIGKVDADGLFSATRAGLGSMIATSGGLADTTGVIQVVAGEIAFIDVTPDSVTVIEERGADFMVKGYDADSNFVSVLTTTVDWSTTDPSGAITAQGVYTAGTDLSPPDYYVIATYPGFADTSIVTIVSDGSVRYLQVEWEDGMPVPDTTLTADDDAGVVYCRGYDSGDNLVGDQIVMWTVTGDSICDFSPQFGSTATLAMHTPGTGRLLATHTPSIMGTSGMITCIPGSPADLVVTPDSALISADSTLDFECISIDADGNATIPQIAPSWSVLGGIGTITGAGLFTPAAAGTGSVIATGGGLVDTTGPVVVVPGLLDSLAITPYRDTVSADSTRLFTAAGFDARGIPVTEVGLLSWFVQGGIGTIDSGGLFTAVTAGYGRIRVVSSLNVEALTDTITLVPGEVTYIDVVPSSQIVVEDSSFKFSAYGYDADSNFVDDYSIESDWFTSDPSGSVTNTGLYTAGHNPSPPAYYVGASLHVPLGALHYVADSSAVTVITSGSLSYVRVEWQSGAAVGDTTLTTDDDGTTMYCRGYDSGDNLLGDAAAMWSMISDDSIGAVAAGPGPSSSLTLSRVGTGEVRASFAPGTSDTTGVITCLAGAPARLVAAPDTATAIAGSSIQFTTSTYDTDWNPTSPVTVDVWEVIGGIGDISGTGLFAAETVGTGAIACSGGGLADSTGSITVLADVLAYLEVSPDSAEVPLSGQQQFTATGVDTYGNAADVGALTWDVTGGIGVISSAGLFTGLIPGSGRVAATSDIGGVSDTNSVVTVLSNNLAYLLVTPDTASVKVSGNVTFIASGFDAGYDPVVPGPLDWEVLGGIGSISSSGQFTASAPGVGYIAATSSITGASDTTNMIVVEVPTAEEIPLGSRAVSAGDVMSPLLAFRVSNSFNGAEGIESISVRDASSGTGTGSQVRTNIDTLDIYVDSNGNSVLDGADTWIASGGFTSTTAAISFAPYIIGPGSSRTFFVSARISDYPHDGDLLDLFLLPGLDIETSNGSTVAGPDTINSLGHNIVDGLVAGQVVLTASGVTTVAPGEGTFNALTVDIPRNGYSQDVLEIFSVFNSGSADTLDIDSLVLYRDNGDNMWSGTGAEYRVGELSFTGSQWELSGISASLAGQMNRFYLASTLSEHPADGATLSFGIPLHGVEMSSDNDGPIDSWVAPVGTISVVSSNAVTVRAVRLDAGVLVPGGDTRPLAAFEFVNGHSEAIDIDEILCTSYASDPAGASQGEIDSQFESVSLWLNRDGDIAARGAEDSLLASGSLSSGTVRFETNGLEMAADGGVVKVFIEAELDADTGKNGNTVNFGIARAADIDFDQAVDVSGTFPVKNADNFIIDIFPASRVGVNPVAGTTLYGGDSDGLVLDFMLPRNGYRDDVLKSLSVVNTGSVIDEDVLQNVKLWADVDPPGFTDTDTLLGYFTLSDAAWDVSGISYPVASGPNRFFVTVDIAPRDFAGGTLRFEIPVGGVAYWSGTDGPDDLAAGNTEAHFVLPANRITVISIPREASTVHPGAMNAQVLTFALYNGYADEAHQLTGTRLSNRTVTVSDDAFADFELGQVSLYYDSNANRTFDGDSLLAAGYFSGGHLNMNGLTVTLPPESLSYFFVTSNLPLGVIDGDTLEVGVEEHSDFAFARSVNLNGDLPLTRGAPLVIDGSVWDQYEPIPVSGQTLSPGDVSVTLFAFRPAVNGDQADVLTSLTIANAGDAGPADITNLKLWVDQNDDDQWQPTDRMSGKLSYADGYWAVRGIEISVEGDVPAMFLTGDVAIGAAPNSSFRAVVPLEGCQYVSGNDGPIDATLVSEQMFVISSSGLRVTYELPQTTYSVGQEVNLRVHVTNILPTYLENIYCDAALVGDSGVLEVDGVNAGPADLESGQTAHFEYDYIAAEQGEVSWLLKAFSSSEPESSATVETEWIEVQTVPAGVVVEMISSIPTAVTRGQSHVFPLSVRYHHADLSPLCAPVRLDSLRVDVKDGLGDGQAASDVFERMVLGAGYTNLAIVEAFDSGSSVLLEFVEPAVISPGEEQILSLRVDIDSTAAATAFGLSIENAASVRFHDSNTGIEVPVDPVVVFPLETASCAINDPSQYLAVSHVPVLGQYANYGQEDVTLMQVILRHYGAVGNSQIKFTGLSFEFEDAGGAPLCAGDLVESVRFLEHQTPLGELSVFDPAGTLLTLWFTSPLVVSAGQSDTVRIEVTLKSESPHTSFGLSIDDSSFFVLRDLSSGSTVPAVGDTAAGVAQPVFPMNSGFAELLQPAQSPEICLGSRLPESIIAGDDSVSLVELAVDYHAGGAYSSLLITSLKVSVLDTLDRSLDPHQLFDRTGFVVGGGPAQYASSIELQGGCTVFRFGENGIEVDPGEEVGIVLLADIESDTPYDHFLMRLQEASAIGIVDATDPARNPGLEEAPGCENLLPFETASTSIYLPAGTPRLDIVQVATQIGAPGQANVPVFMGDLSYETTSPQGDLVLVNVTGGVFRRTPSGDAAFAAADVFDAVHLLSGDDVVATDSALAGAGITLIPGEEYVISRGTEHALGIACDLRASAEPGNYVIEFDDATFMELADRNLETTAYPGIPGAVFPLRSAEISIASDNLADSFTNYPNPFNPARGEETTIGFYITESARVDIEIFTITGDLVKKVVSNSERPQGAYHEDAWAGLNAEGLGVLPGTYLCRITAAYASGRVESCRRKVMVIR